jgi:P pilus assembly chaperone PapD
MRLSKFAILMGLAASAWSGGARAAGDLLVAPTRVVLDGARGTEVILNNIDSVPATYRVSLELRRMDAQGNLDEITPENATPAEAQALNMITYAPRRVELAPNQPQSIRIGLRAPADLPDGEYRVHMLFRAIPDARPVTETEQVNNGLSIALTPIYGVTIPVIIRKGALKATAAIGDTRLVRTGDHVELAMSLAREGARSTFGRIRVLKPGKSEPAFEARGVAIYPEVTRRNISFPIDAATAAALAGPATIQYLEEPEAGGRMIAETQTVIK